MSVSFDRSLPMILHRTLDATMPGYRELFARYNLTEQQWRVLRVLWSDGRISLADLSARTLLPAPSLVGIVDRLEKKQLVTRVRSQKDRRSVLIDATEQGRALEAEVAPHVAVVDRQLRAAVSEEEWQTMEHILTRISQAACPASPKGGEPAARAE